LLKALDRLQIVAKDVRLRAHDRFEWPNHSVEIRNEHLDTHAGTDPAKTPDCGREEVGAAVGKIVASDGCHNHVLESKPADRVGNSRRFVLVEPKRPTCLDATICRLV
jgi:hypothetical protein